MLLLMAAVSAADWAVVTGASSGIGRALAIEAASRGYSIALAARRRSELAAVAAEIKSSFDVDALPIAVDLSAKSGPSDLHRATRHLQNITLVIANAGFSVSSDLTAMALQDIERMTAVNAVSVAAMCRLFGADLTAGGALLITSSLTALAPLPHTALYAATRAFVHSLAGGLAIELRPRRILVRCVMPGATDTGFSRAARIETSLAFNFPLGRLLKVISSAEDVAAAALNSIAAVAPRASTHLLSPSLLSALDAPVDVVPSFMQRAYALSARALLPRALAARFSSAFFGSVSPLSSFAELVRSLPVIVPAALAIVAALPLVLVQDAVESLPTPLLMLLVLCMLVVLNIKQNGRPDHPPPPAIAHIGSMYDVRRLFRCKADFVAAWRCAPAPTLRARFAGKTFDAHTVHLGVLAPASAFITHVLFGGVVGGRWLGKRFYAGAVHGGDNRFARVGHQCPFEARISVSRYDGKPALVLDYAPGGSFLWGTVLGMRDELREVAPGVWLGLGSMAASGGVANSAPFVMFERV